MKKSLIKSLSVFLVLALILSMSLSLTASAVQSSTVAGIYFVLQGTCEQNASNPYALNTTTAVKKNPDSAWLRTDIALLDGINQPTTRYFYSERGAKSFSYDYAMHMSITSIPQIAYCTHNVLGGTTSEEAFAIFHEIELEWP